MSRLRTLAVLSVPLSLAGLVAVAGPAAASGGGGGVRASGSCSTTSTWKLEAKHDDGRVEVEAEVDSDVVGQTWNWRLLDSGVLVASGTRTTLAPSGSFSVERRVADRAGTDTLRFRATRANGAETCVGTVRL